MTASLAEYLVMNGKKVIAFNLSGGDEFRYINGQAQYRDVNHLTYLNLKRTMTLFSLTLERHIE